MNSILSCLAGGRNKLMASKAYEMFNLELEGSGLAIKCPDTMTDVSLEEIPLYVKSMGWHAVIKIPYANAGTGVFTISSKRELDEFIIQSLVGNSNWSSTTKSGKYYHVGTMPNFKN